jgi:hypothetical protein
MESVPDEFAEHEFQNVAVGALWKSADGEFQRLKSMLLDQLTTVTPNIVE